MIAAQAMAAHHASMECSRRAMVPDQPFEAAQGLRKAAANASRVFIELLAAFDRQRGKGGQQVVRVEHVHVHPGGQAVVGNIAAATGGRGAARNPRETPCARPTGAFTCSLAQSCPRCGARTRSGRPCQSRRCRTSDAGCTAGEVHGTEDTEGLARIRGPDNTRDAHGRDGTDARTGAGAARRR